MNSPQHSLLLDFGFHLHVFLEAKGIFFFFSTIENRNRNCNKLRMFFGSVHGKEVWGWISYYFTLTPACEQGNDCVDRHFSWMNHWQMCLFLFNSLLLYLLSWLLGGSSSPSLAARSQEDSKLQCHLLKDTLHTVEGRQARMFISF